MDTKMSRHDQSQKPVNVGQETEHRLDVLHLAEHLGSDDGVGLEHLEKAVVQWYIQKPESIFFPIKSPKSNPYL